MTDQGASQRRANSSTITITGQTAGLSPKGNSGESYVFTDVLAFVDTNNGFTSVASKNLLSPAGLSAIETSPNTGKSYFNYSLINIFTEISNSFGSRNRANNITKIGNLINELISGSGISYQNTALPLTGVNAIIVNYLLAAYDSNGVRRHWLSFNISFTSAPLLNDGVTFVGSPVVLGIF